MEQDCTTEPLASRHSWLFWAPPVLLGLAAAAIEILPASLLGEARRELVLLQPYLIGLCLVMILPGLIRAGWPGGGRQCPAGTLALILMAGYWAFDSAVLGQDPADRGAVFTASEILLVAGTVVSLAALALDSWKGLALIGSFWSLGVIVSAPMYRLDPERAQVRRCYALQKTVAGALEMYELDTKTTSRQLTQQTLDALLKGGYMQPPLVHPGPWSRLPFVLRGPRRSIECLLHGPIAEPGPPPASQPQSSPTSGGSHSTGH